MSMPFAENLYSFRAIISVLPLALGEATPDLEVLATIEAKLVEANNLFLTRRYQEAIASYRLAAALNYSEINHRYPNDAIINDPRFPRNTALFDPLLSASLEWMNVLPVHHPVVSVQPREPVDLGLFKVTRAIEQTGLSSSILADPKAVDATANWQLSKVFEAQGNTNAARFFLERAKEINTYIFQMLQADPTPEDGNLTPVIGDDPMIPSPILNAPLGAARLRDIVFLPTRPLPKTFTVEGDRSFVTIVGQELVQVQWKAGDAVLIDQVRANTYQKRISITELDDLFKKVTGPADVALELPHDYYYVIPLGLAECYHALGDYTTAEGLYFEAAAYQYLNAAVEAPYLWQRIALLYPDWGGSLFRNDNQEDALPIYSQVLAPDDTEPVSKLYTTPSLKPGADVARTVITLLEAVMHFTRPERWNGRNYETSGWQRQ